MSRQRSKLGHQSPGFSNISRYSSIGADQRGRDTISYLRETMVLKDRFQMFRKFRQCFTGSEAVDAIIKFHGCNREEAVKLGANLLTKGLIRHVTDRYV